MLTGANPGKHGIFDFIQPDTNGSFRLADARARSRHTFIDHAENNKIRAVSLLVPYTFPPNPETSSLVVSGLGTPSAESDFIRPHVYRDSILGEFPYLSKVDPTSGESIETLHSALHMHTLETARLSRFAMNETSDWGLIFTVFQATDLIPHFYSRYFDLEHPDYDQDEDVPQDYRNALLRIYEAVDPYLGECLDLVDESGGWVILVSDHGSAPLMGAIGKDAFLARWLEDNGYLVTSGEKGRRGREAKAAAGSLANRLLYLAKKYTPHGIRNAVNVVLGKKKKDITEKLTRIPFMEGIVWEQTRAFCAPGGYGVGLYINRAGDFPSGTVQPGAEYNSLRDRIKNELESIEIEGGVPLFNGVLARDEALWGPAVNLAPDLLLLWNEDIRIRKNNYVLSDGRTMDPPEVKSGSRLTWCGTHRMEGLFGLYGEGVVPGFRPEIPVNLTDILPIVNYLSGMPIPEDADGRIPDGIFDKEFLNQNKPVTGPPDEPVSPGGGIQTPDESEKMLELLEGLGYLN